jgi:hypothetical protein
MVGANVGIYRFAVNLEQESVKRRVMNEVKTGRR